MGMGRPPGRSRQPMRSPRQRSHWQYQETGLRAAPYPRKTEEQGGILTLRNFILENVEKMPHIYPQEDKVVAAWLPEEPICSTGDRSNGIEHSLMYITFVRIYLWVGAEVGAGIQCTQDGCHFCFHGT